NDAPISGVRKLVRTASAPTMPPATAPMTTISILFFVMECLPLYARRAPSRSRLERPLFVARLPACFRLRWRIELPSRERQRVGIHAHRSREFERIFSAAGERQLDEISRVAFLRLRRIADVDPVLLFGQYGRFIRGA